MEVWDTVRGLLLQGDFLVRIDLKDAYLSIPISSSDRPWLCFLYHGTCYQWNVLPFGLTSAPRVFTKLMKPVVAYLRSRGVRLVIYLDDILIMDQSPCHLLATTSFVVDFLHALGFIVNQSKSHLVPTRKLLFLGFEVSTSPEPTLGLPLGKGQTITQELKALLQGPRRARHLAKVIGLLSATSLAILEAPLHLRSLQSLLHQTLKQGSYESTITLTVEATKDLQWWSKKLLSCPTRPLREKSVVQIIQSDSSLRGWGASSEGSVVGQQWTSDQARLHINELELVAALLGLKALVKAPPQGRILLQLDNRTVVAAINRMGSTRSSRLNQVALELWSWCLNRGLTVQAQYIPGSLNVVADRASRFRFDSSSWRLHPLIFRKVVKLWGPILVDLFADLSNFQVPHYFSWKPNPGSAGVDAFSQPWSGPAMVSVPPASFMPGASSDSSTSRPSTEFPGCSSSTVGTGPSPGGMESDQRPLTDPGLSGEAAELISASWRRGTKLVYSACWRKWDSWCSTRSMDSLSPPITAVLNFLAHLHFNERLAYRTINCYRSALSQIIGSCEGYPLCEHPSVSRLLRGVFNLNPPLPKYTTTWPVEVVTSYISSLGSNSSLPLRLLTYKLTMLLALATAGRSADLRLLSTEGIRQRVLGWDIALNGLRKTSRPSGTAPSLFIPALPQEPLLCPVLCLQSYIARTLPHRNSCPQLLLTTQKPYKPASRDTIANWLKRVLNLAGIDTRIFQAHSTRGAATSKALDRGVPVSEILKVADWSSDTTFNRFYRREARSGTSFGVQVLSQVCTQL
ncbi:uncharacterized protein LOC135372255 [Ornithodoros turicata]|uniref:uncharacterized protein LOC135372255 n=1 Tax=Ornithodoros turicata TaxID=34597 RepID=UPI00313A1A54